jgi:hypothetical protein
MTGVSAVLGAWQFHSKVMFIAEIHLPNQLHKSLRKALRF